MYNRSVESRTRTECSRWPWEVRRCFGRDEELDVVTRAHTECPRWPREVRCCLGRDEELDVVTRAHTECSRWTWEVRRCFGRDEELDVVKRTRTECPRWPREGQSLLWTEWRARCLYRAVSRSVRPDGRDATRALCSQLASRLAGSRSLMFRWVELLDYTDCGSSECPSLILCRLAERDPMQLIAAMLHVDWLDGRTLGDLHLG
jgi:hypothetical protein